MDKARAACLACPCARQKGNAHTRGGVVSLDAMGERTMERARLAVPEARGRATDLPEAVEERLAELFRRLVSLDAIDALLMLHVANGGTTAKFGAFLERTRKAIEKTDCKRAAFRATVWAKFKRLARMFAPFLRGKLQSWDDGHGGAIRKERESAELESRQQDFFDVIN